MFISALQPYAVAIIIGVIALQYVFALFCLFKLAYLDITKKQYVLWNLFILLVFFVGCITFLVYYNKVKADKTIPPFEPTPKEDASVADNEGETSDGQNKNGNESEAVTEIGDNGAADSSDGQSSRESNE